MRSQYGVGVAAKLTKMVRNHSVEEICEFLGWVRVWDWVFGTGNLTLEVWHWDWEFGTERLGLEIEHWESGAMSPGPGICYWDSGTVGIEHCDLHWEKVFKHNSGV